MKDATIIFVCFLCLVPFTLVGQSKDGYILDSLTIKTGEKGFGQIYFEYRVGESEERSVEAPFTLLVEKGKTIPIHFHKFRFKALKKEWKVSARFIFPASWPLTNNAPESLSDQNKYFYKFLKVTDALALEESIKIIVEVEGMPQDLTYTLRESIEIQAEESPPLSGLPSEPLASPQKAARPPTRKNTKDGAGPEDGAEVAGGVLDYPSLDAYIKEHEGTPELLQEKLREVVMEWSPSYEGQRVDLDLKYLNALEIVSVSDTEVITVETFERIGPTSFRLGLVLLDANSHKIVLRDSTKAENFSKLSINLGEPLFGEIKQLPDGVAFTNLMGGVPPYYLIFRRDDQEVFRFSDVPTTGISILTDSLSAIYPQGGAVNVQLFDQRLNGNYTFDGQSINIPAASSLKMNWQLPLLLLTGLLAVGIWQVIRMRRKRKTLSTARRLLEEEGEPNYSEDEPSPFAEPEITGAGAAAPVKEITTEKVEENTMEKTDTSENNEGDAPGNVLEDTSENSEEDSSENSEAVFPSYENEEERNKKKKTRMKISRRTTVHPDERPPFRPDQFPLEYLELFLGKHWNYSMVSSVLLGKNAVTDLDNFLRDENTSKIDAAQNEQVNLGYERNATVPEIGGMLLGQFVRTPSTNTYRVSLEEFVPLEAKYQSIVKVEIDPMSLARDLGQAQDRFPDLTVVAWFHTHPGHGLFLSRPDLNIHHSHFRKPYHLAMEIDSLSSGLDTAFFSYIPNGQMNNRHSLIPETPWFSWRDIVRSVTHQSQP